MLKYFHIYSYEKNVDGNKKLNQDIFIYMIMIKNYQKMEIKKFIESITIHLIYRKNITEE